MAARIVGFVGLGLVPLLAACHSKLVDSGLGPSSSGGTGASESGTPSSNGTGGTSSGGGSGGNISDAASGTGGSIGPDASTGADAESSGCVGNWIPGDYPPGLTQETYLDITGVAGQQGLTRQYKVHVPPSYDCHVPTPVVFCLHGLSQTAVSFCVNGTASPTSSGMPDKSDKEGFILVMPNGYQNSWNGAGCCGGAATLGLDDVGLMKAILEETKKHLHVDSRRVFATGFSNGGYLSYRLACEAADTFTAVAPASAGIQSSLTACVPSAKISVLDIHGTADPLVPYSLQKPSLDHVASANGCSTTTSSAAVPSSGGDTTCVTYAGCAGGVEVSGCTVQNGGHVWFGDPSCGTGAGAVGCAFVGANSNWMVNTDAVWNFFSRLSR